MQVYASAWPTLQLAPLLAAPHYFYFLFFVATAAAPASTMNDTGNAVPATPVLGLSAVLLFDELPEFDLAVVVAAAEVVLFAVVVSAVSAGASNTTLAFIGQIFTKVFPSFTLITFPSKSL